MVIENHTFIFQLNISLLTISLVDKPLGLGMFTTAKVGAGVGSHFITLHMCSLHFVWEKPMNSTVSSSVISNQTLTLLQFVINKPLRPEMFTTAAAEVHLFILHLHHFPFVGKRPSWDHHFESSSCILLNISAVTICSFQTTAKIGTGTKNCIYYYTCILSTQEYNFSVWLGIF